MLGLLGFLLLVWIVLIIVGAAVKGLAWLVIIGVVLFAATAVFGWIRRETFTRPR